MKVVPFIDGGVLPAHTVEGTVLRFDMTANRVEVTTAGNGLDAFKQTGECFARNIAAVANWQPVKE